ncbi:eukaryotic translation initiation factor 3 subunit A-like [Hemiscyllium ocellatum]|uniref:eukaryotic translation initiation factor 3 subunit A-like n=1 Tax=Hemiscyllium ocellatum TaxID=170820 RepID=UPI0029667C9C|nr:eukaryotic translation initiation factor 3 subunit A-like [Hemiscyllium ocellatum]
MMRDWEFGGAIRNGSPYTSVAENKYVGAAGGEEATGEVLANGKTANVVTLTSLQGKARELQTGETDVKDGDSLIHSTWELQEEERITSMKVEREKALEHKNRMSRMMEDQDQFLTKLMASRRTVYEEKLKNFQDRLNEERKMRLEERKKQRKEERRRLYYIQKEEEAQRLEEEKLKKEREEKERCEREKREAEEREYQEKLRKLEETERKRRQREMEIEERERRKEEERKYAEDQFRRKESQRWSDRDSERDGWRDSRIIERESEWRRGGTDAEWRRGEGRGFDDDRPAFRRGDDRIRRDDDREPLFRRGDDDRGPLFRRGDDDRGSWRDDDRGSRRDDDRGPRRVDDSRPGPWRPLDKPGGGWREREKAREESWGPPRDTRSSEDNRDRDLDRDQDRDRRIAFRDKDDGPWRRGGGSEDSSSWREIPRRDDRDGDRDRRDLRERRDIRTRKDEPERRAASIRSDRDDGTWRRGEERQGESQAKEVQDTPVKGPPLKDNDQDKSIWKTDKDKETSRRIKNVIDDEGWTTVRR